MKELVALTELKLEVQECNNPQRLISLAEETTAKILNRVTEIQKNIEDAKKLNYDAENASKDRKNKWTLGVFGKSATDKRSELNTKINTLQNEAISDLNTMMKEIARLTMVSSHFSRILAQFLSQAMKEGFKDSSGQLKKCNENVRAVIGNIISIAEQTALEQEKNKEKELAIEINREQIGKNLKYINNIKTSLENKGKLDDEQSKNILDNSKNIAYNKWSISKNTDAIGIINEKMNKKDLLDDEQSREIADIKSIMLEKSELDKEQEQSIAELQKQIQKLNAELESINKNSNNKTSILAILISIFALVISILALLTNKIQGSL